MQQLTTVQQHTTARFESLSLAKQFRPVMVIFLSQHVNIHVVPQVWQKATQISPLGLTPGLPHQPDPTAILCLDQSPALLELPGLSSTTGRALRCRSWCISQAVRAAHAIRIEKGTEETEGTKGTKGLSFLFASCHKSCKSKKSCRPRRAIPEYAACCACFC